MDSSCHHHHHHHPPPHRPIAVRLSSSGTTRLADRCVSGHRRLGAAAHAGPTASSIVPLAVPPWRAIVVVIVIIVVMTMVLCLRRAGHQKKQHKQREQPWGPTPCFHIWIARGARFSLGDEELVLTYAQKTSTRCDAVRRESEATEGTKAVARAIQVMPTTAQAVLPDLPSQVSLSLLLSTTLVRPCAGLLLLEVHTHIEDQDGDVVAAAHFHGPVQGTRMRRAP